MKKRNMFKSIATVAAVSAGVLFAGSQSASASTTKHTVVEGDTLNKLSAQYGVSVQDLAQANAIQDINKIYVGEVFTIGDDGQVSVSDQSAVAAAPVAQAATTTQAPVQATAPVQQAAAPVAQAPVQAAAPAQQAAPATSSVSGSDAAAKDWIAGRESGGNYGASNGQYVGKYQLSASYLNGDYSPANQEAVADNYVASRYGSWSGAQAFWQANGWY